MALGFPDSTFMTVTYSTGQQPGETLKGVQITTDQKERGIYNAKVKAYVESPTAKTPQFFAEPRSIDFAPAGPKSSGMAQVQLINNGDLPREIKVIDYSGNLGTVKLSSEKVNPGQKMQLTFIFTETEPAGLQNGSITLAASAGEKDIIRYTVPIVLRVPSSIAH